ncbi:glycosyltransferase [Chitinophaga sp. SYP-B3965]|uniref:glycosyltransferase family 4 protein n=1 Tax=Chitinophaga sp. SYP-B3965 TaxID=2663120 RepID=UPI0012999FF8|nr:glycosyltransferase [Chitinophaga sp. SYP-B3965]MRG44881.1 glycosyltransferase [Chitinophaga sp. SYP-B3965]
MDQTKDVMYQWLILKRRIEGIFIFPFALLGRLIARFKPLPEEYDLFLFFPFYHVGGAEKVHSEIAQLFPEKKVIIFFTKKSMNDAMLPKFTGSNITIRNISTYTDNKYLYFNNLIWRGITAAYISRQRNAPVVFNGQCNFAYKLSPHLPEGIRQVELIHSFCSFSYIRIPFIPFYTTTVMISRDSIAEHIKLYKAYKIPKSYAEKIQLVMNGIPLPPMETTLLQSASLQPGETSLQSASMQPGETPLQSAPAASLQPTQAAHGEAMPRMLYVGRGTAEKRPHLVARIAQQANTIAGFMGAVEDAIPTELRPYCHFYGEQTDAATIDAIYREHQVIVITSSREGFPMVIMEAMARGLAVLATDVGDIPYHVKNGENGFLLDHTKKEKDLVSLAADLLEIWQSDPSLLQTIARNNIAYAQEHFGMRAFAEAYRKLLL